MAAGLADRARTMMVAVVMMAAMLMVIMRTMIVAVVGAMIMRGVVMASGGVGMATVAGMRR